MSLPDSSPMSKTQIAICPGLCLYIEAQILAGTMSKQVLSSLLAVTRNSDRCLHGFFAVLVAIPNFHTPRLKTKTFSTGTCR
jgi:hypothetical protein